MALSPNQLQSIIDLIRRDPEARRQLQAALEMEPLLELPSRMERLEEIVADLAAAQRRAEARLEGVEARLAGVEDRLTRLEQTVQKLADNQVSMQETMQRIERWQIGDEGRRKGEQYERTVERRISRLLGDGEGGGLQRDLVYSRLQSLTQTLPDLLDLDEEADPMLADIIWWKGDRYAVVEVSLRVDRLDVLRAARRAETLRQAGVEALGVVIGEEWLAEDTETLARDRSVAWKVGESISPALIAFRQ